MMISMSACVLFQWFDPPLVMWTSAGGTADTNIPCLFFSNKGPNID